MNARLLELAFWGIALGAGVSLTSSVRALHDSGSHGARARVNVRVATPADTSSSDSIEHAAAALAGTDPFRTSHQPPSLDFGSPEAEQAEYPVVRPPRPALLLQGVVGAAPSWSAIVVGIPGRDGGVLLHQGDTLSGLKVTSVSAKSVVIQGSDTTWHLGLKGPWQ